MALVGCNHPASEGSTANTPSASPPKPAAKADESTWGNYLSEQGRLHGKDVSVRPYIYVIPGGDNVAANDRRQNETDSIVHGIGPILKPGGMLILGGADSKQTTLFVTNLGKQLKADAMKGIVVMVVNDISEQTVDATALKPSGAALRFVAM
ncbi:hypothetical protein [Dyella choica]|nr:hypothetical protein [Dyella choica]